jgi:hypothetical protein
MRTGRSKRSAGAALAGFGGPVLAAVHRMVLLSDGDYNLDKAAPIGSIGLIGATHVKPSEPDLHRRNQSPRMA